MRWFDLSLTIGSVLLWIVAALMGWIGSTIFIGHVSMLALVYAAWSAYRSDVPPDEGG